MTSPKQWLVQWRSKDPDDWNIRSKRFESSEEASYFWRKLTKAGYAVSSKILFVPREMGEKR